VIMFLITAIVFTTSLLCLNSNLLVDPDVEIEQSISLIQDNEETDTELPVDSPEVEKKD